MKEVRKLKYLILTAWIILTILYGVRLWAYNKVAGLGQTLNLIREQSDNLMLENMILEQKIAEEESFKVIEQKAKRMGFEETKAVYLMGRIYEP